MKSRRLRSIGLTALAVLMPATLAWGRGAAQLAPFMIMSAPYNYAKEHAAKQAFKNVTRAQGQVSHATEEVRKTFESTEEWQTAIRESRQARIHFERLRSVALNDLRAGAEYKAEQIEIYKLQQSLDTARAARRQDFQRVSFLARQVLERRAALSKLENDLLSDNSEVRQARYAMIDAEAMVNTLRKSHVESIRFDPQWRAARAQLDQARAHLKAVGR